MTTINHECYVDLEVAKLLKQAGFDWKCIRYYQNDDETLYGPLVGQYKLVETNFNVAPVYMNQYSAPTIDVAQRWLREVKNEYVVIEIDAPGFYKVSILGRDCTSKSFKTYEEAQEEGIKNALKIVLEKGE